MGAFRDRRDEGNHNHGCDPCGDTATQYRFYIQQDQLFFGVLTVGHVSDDIEVMVKNVGWADILIQSMTVTGPFTLDRTKCPDVLKPGREGKLVFNFVPTTFGAQTGSVFIDAGRAGEHYITLFGAGYTSNEQDNDLAGIPIFQVRADNGQVTSLENEANLVYDQGTIALVYNDDTLSNNDFYKKIGDSGEGSWQRAGKLANTIDLAQRDMADIAKIANEPADFNGDGLVDTRLNGDVPTLRKLEKNFDDSLAAHETDYETSQSDHETAWETSQTEHEEAFQEQTNNVTALTTNAFDAPDPNDPAGLPGTVTVAPGVVHETMALTLERMRQNNRFMAGTWAVLDPLKNTRMIGATAEVPITDVGTHPSVVGDLGASEGNTPNTGIFTLIAAGWKRIGDFVAPQLALVGDRTANNKAVSPIGVEAQITAHLGDPDAADEINYRGSISVQNALDRLFYVPLTIPSMSVTPNQIETGDAQNVTVAWTVGGDVTSQTLEGVDVPVGTLSKVFNGVNTSNTYDLVIEDEEPPTGTPVDQTVETRSASVTVLPKWYAGASLTTNPDDATLRGFVANGFASVRGRTLSFNTTGGRYPVYAYPASLGAIGSIKVGGLTFTDYTVTTRDVVNAHGASISMNIVVFNTLQNGSAIEVVFA